MPSSGRAPTWCSRGRPRSRWPSRLSYWSGSARPRTRSTGNACASEPSSRRVAGAMRRDHPIHGAAAAGEIDVVRRLLDADPSLLGVHDRKGATPLHRAVAAGARDVVTLLADRGADLNVRHLDGPGDAASY